MYVAEGKKIDTGYKANRNVVVVGAPGTGKSRYVIIPGLMTIDGSVAVLDPKGELYDMTKDLMEKRGYDIYVIDFKDPFKTQQFYNPLMHIRKDKHMEDDIVRVSRLLLDEQWDAHDPFWSRAAQLLANAIIGFLIEECDETDITFTGMSSLLKSMSCEGESVLDILMKELKEKNPKSFAVSQYELFKSVGTSDKTFSSIVISLVAAFANVMSKGMTYLTSKDTIDFLELGQRKIALYIKSSDTDRSKDKIVSLLFSQMMDELCTYADEKEKHCLDTHVHFFLDDFGTNLRIPEFDSYIAGMRSREMSCSVILQSEAQLRKLYGESWATIIASCGNYIFLGTNDLDTCTSISRRLNRPLEEVLYKKREDIFLFAQHEKPEKCKRYDISKDLNYRYFKEL